MVLYVHYSTNCTSIVRYRLINYHYLLSSTILFSAPQLDYCQFSPKISIVLGTKRVLTKSGANVVDVMTSFKQSIAWTAVLLYHRLKLAATSNNRRQLVKTTFCTGVLHKLASFFRTSVKSISTIVGINDCNIKRIYN